MKLTKENQREIENIIKKEMLTMKEGWVRSDTSKRRSTIIEKRLFEDSASGDLHDAAEALTDACVDAAGTAMHSFDVELYDHIVSVLTSHGMVSSRFSAEELIEELSDYDTGSLQEAQMQLTDALAGALGVYADSIATLVINAYDDRGISDEIESPDKLLPQY